MFYLSNRKLSYYTHLYDGQLFQADGYLVQSHLAADELKQKISELLSL